MISFLNNELYRCGYMLNYGLREPSGVHASWFVQYFNNQIHEGHSQVEASSDQRNPQLFGRTVTRYCVQLRKPLKAPFVLSLEAQPR